MKLLTLTEANQLEEMLKSEGWKVYQTIVNDILKNIEREVLARTNSIEKKDDMLKEYYHLQDCMKLPVEAIQTLVIHEKNMETPKKEFDPYYTLKNITKYEE